MAFPDEQGGLLDAELAQEEPQVMSRPTERLLASVALAVMLICAACAFGANFRSGRPAIREEASLQLSEKNYKFEFAWKKWLRGGTGLGVNFYCDRDLFNDTDVLRTAQVFQSNIGATSAQHYTIRLELFNDTSQESRFIVFELGNAGAEFTENFAKAASVPTLGLSYQLHRFESWSAWKLGGPADAVINGPNRAVDSVVGAFGGMAGTTQSEIRCHELTEEDKLNQQMFSDLVASYADYHRVCRESMSDCCREPSCDAYYPSRWKPRPGDCTDSMVASGLFAAEYSLRYVLEHPGYHMGSEDCQTYATEIFHAITGRTLGAQNGHVASAQCA